MAETHRTVIRVKDTTGKANSIIIKIAGAGLFSTLSLLVSLLTTSVIPRFGWGLAWFDPVSVIWILAFFVFGYESGIITSVVGMFLLFPFDPFAPFGPIFKFTATIPLIIVPFIIEKIRKHPITSDYTLKFRNLGFNWLVALLVRLILMIPLNIIAIATIFSDWKIWDTHTLGFIGLNSLGGWMAIVITVIFSNIIQSISDYLVPIALIKPIQAATPLTW